MLRTKAQSKLRPEHVSRRKGPEHLPVLFLPVIILSLRVLPKEDRELDLNHRVVSSEGLLALMNMNSALACHDVSMKRERRASALLELDQLSNKNIRD